MRAALLLGLLALTPGCLHVVSTAAPATSLTGEAWYVEAKAFAFFQLSPKVFYCPLAAESGPVTCRQAEMVPLEGAKASGAEPKAKAAPPAKKPTKRRPPVEEED